MATHDLFVPLSRRGVLSRRSFLCSAAASALGGATWMSAVRSQTAELRKRGMACILLFMQGGPSQFETFDPKPGTDTGGATKAIDTAAAGIRLAEFWPKLARQMKDVALIRSMTGREGNHQRAQYLVHTGYLPAGSVKYPSVGSVAARELGDEKFDLPPYVCIGGMPAGGSGFLGMQYAPYLVRDAEKMPPNSVLPPGVTPPVLKRRLALMGKLEKDFADAGAEALVADHRALNETAARLALSPHLQAFDLSREKDKMRDDYGRTAFGQGCLLARRLIEVGVTFVEVVSGNWDTHRDNHVGHKALAGAVDPAFAALLADLKDRGLLKKTLIVWMGEFGRTPRINANNGRDHHPRSYSVALAGGGVAGGQAVGATDDKGLGVEKRPVTVADLCCSIYHVLGINPRKQNHAAGRPIRIVEGGAAIKELFG